MKKQLITISNQIERQIPVEELDTAVISKRKEIKDIIYHYLPLGILYPLTVDYEVIKKRKKNLKKNR